MWTTKVSAISRIVVMEVLFQIVGRHLSHQSLLSWTLKNSIVVHIINIVFGVHWSWTLKDPNFH